MHWKGLSGGTEVWKELGEFFSSLKARAVEVNPAQIKAQSPAQSPPQSQEESHA